MLKYYSIALDDRPPITGDHVDTLLKSLLKAGEPVTYGCGAGNCGACRYVLAQGEVDQKNDSILSESQRQAGEILACQCRPLSDLVLRSPARQQGDPVTLSGQITRVERPTADLVKLRIKLESLLDFEPGQYGLLKTPYGPARPYSFASPGGQPVVEFHIRAVPGGKTGQALYENANRGDPIELTGPMGNAYAKDLNRPICMIATGTGLAPMKSVLARLIQIQHPGPVRLIWGNRAEQDLYEVRAIQAMMDGIDDAKFVQVFSREGACLRVTDVLQSEVPSLMGWTVFCAGNPDMVRDVEGQVALMGLNQENWHADPFTAAED